MKEIKAKTYLHFDNRMKYENVKNYVENPKKIEKHSFFPLIQYTSSFERYDRDKGKRPVKIKDRTIMYAAHLDGFIYSYYGRKLNTSYNTWVLENDIDECSIAYRDNKAGKCNIDFAAELINQICEYKDCFIMVGDYKNFFETLNHSILKERLKEVLSVNELRKDWYQVYKSVTKYRYIEKDLINKKFGKDGQIKEKLRNKKKERLKTGVKKRIKWSYFQTYPEFREFIRSCGVNLNTSAKGIPQGTAMSAILANVYMIKLDQQIKNLVTSHMGIYRRYSDDFIIVIPRNASNTKETFQKIKESTESLIGESGLTLQTTKTKIYAFQEHRIFNLETSQRTAIDYLGFVFDGENVRMRQKSPYKFYRKAYQLIEIAKKKSIEKDTKKILYRGDIYNLYSDRGIGREPYGNFITYAMRSQRVFDRVCDTNNLMMNQIKNREQKIRKKMRMYKNQTLHAE
ncbi:reverse transcriptase domain-containing protein [Listeria booriae]|nr:reverse transcriptase domain-containing protein [Listeria booriae]MBC2025621.1 RNA-dependent DNA polymerase [Listeria booriae]